MKMCFLVKTGLVKQAPVTCCWPPGMSWGLAADPVEGLLEDGEEVGSALQQQSNPPHSQSSVRMMDEAVRSRIASEGIRHAPTVSEPH